MTGENRSNETNTETNNKTPPPPDNAPRSWTEAENPFIAFRRYADEQISTMLQSVMGLPSMSVPPFSDKWVYFENQDNSNKSDLVRKSNGDNERKPDSQAEGHWSPRRWNCQWDENSHHGWDSHRRSSDFSFNSFLDSFPMNLGLSFLFPESMLSDGDTQTWPLAYLLFSPYSPLYLERSQERSRHHGRNFSALFSSRKPAEQDPNEPQWRDAFEDLLRVTNGQDLLDQSTESERSRQSANEWLRGLAQRGSLGDNWKLLGPEDSAHGFISQKMQSHSREKRGQDPQFSPDAREESSETNDAETELDLYDRFLDDIANAHERYSRAFADSPLMRLLDEERKRHMRREDNSQGPGDENAQSKDWLEYTFDGNKDLLASQSTSEDVPSEPRVVSTMTRSVRRTLADGSVSTKTVKTKRFADGREESDESVEVTPPPSAEVDDNHSRTSGNDRQVQEHRGGWFWTR